MFSIMHPYATSMQFLTAMSARDQEIGKKTEISESH